MMDREVEIEAMGRLPFYIDPLPPMDDRRIPKGIILTIYVLASDCFHLYKFI